MEALEGMRRLGGKASRLPGFFTVSLLLNRFRKKRGVTL
jgi:hypothetical protein